ncbi:MAG: lysoplasmalogenase [Chloroflexota bacterium]
MKTALYLIPVLLITVVFLIRAELLKLRNQIFLLKPTATLLVIAVAALSFFEPNYNPTCSIGVLIGLLLSLGGDIALLFQDNKEAFTIGLGLFLAAHIAYMVVFILLGQHSSWDLVSGAILLSAGFALFRLFAPNLGSMKVPVIAYIVIISLMVNQALATFSSPVFSNAQAWMIAGGALLFYISDVILAANRFWRPWKYQRISLAFYYSGQVLIALAASFFIAFARIPTSLLVG